jgi:large subunit ribosomal protein L29
MSGVVRVKAEELRTLDSEELEGRLKGARRELYELRFKLAVGQLDDHRQVRKVRKDIARILTAVHQRRLEGVLVGVGAPVEDAAAVDEATETGGAVEASEGDAPVAPTESPENVEAAADAEPEAEPKPASRRRRAASEEAE